MSLTRHASQCASYSASGTLALPDAEPRQASSAERGLKGCYALADDALLGLLRHGAHRAAAAAARRGPTKRAVPGQRRLNPAATHFR